MAAMGGFIRVMMGWGGMENMVAVGGWRRTLAAR